MSFIEIYSNSNIKEELILSPQAFFIKELIKSCGYKSYLELGIYDGATFLFINNELSLFSECVDITENKRINTDSFYKMTTDEYFEQSKHQFDIIFIDACHEFNQVKKDFENSLKILNKFGTIILHDTDPFSKEYTQPGYCGDSYKMNDYLEIENKYQFVTIPFQDCGLTIVKRKDDLRYKGFIK